MSQAILRAQPGQSLTLEEMQRNLPSIFAKGPHGSRSKRYEYISTADMIGRLMKGGFLPVEAQSARTRKPDRMFHTKHMLRFRGKDELDKPDNFTGPGEVAYEVILRNAHDGSGAYQMLAGLIRFACSNGLVISDGTVATVKVYHIGNHQKILDTILEGANTVLEQGPKVGDKIKSWRKLQLDDEERFSFVRAAHKIRFTKTDNGIVPDQLLIPRRPADEGNSLWQIFNVVQENVVRGGIEGLDTKRCVRVTSRPIASIDDTLKLNRRLWELAERAGTLKQNGMRATSLEFV